MKKLFTLCLTTLMSLSLIACNATSNDKEVAANTTTTSENNTVVIEMEDGDIIKVELDPTSAPITVENFKKLVNKGFYDGLTFHRIIKGFMIQGGDPLGTGTGGADETIKGEFKSNGVDNTLSHKRGVISMARAMNPDSASSQFFIVHEDSDFLDGDYAAFGKVIEGMDVVDKIANVKTDSNDKPLTPVVMKKVYLEQ